jgi:hypothetical protein
MIHGSNKGVIVPFLKWLCTNCGIAFNPPFHVIGGGTIKITFEKSKFVCPRCNSIENIPDGTFQGTVNGLIRIIEDSENPLSKAEELLAKFEKYRKSSENLQELKSDESLSLIKTWLPNTPQKLSAYIAIISFLYNLLSKQPDIKLEYNETFINQYNEFIMINNTLNYNEPFNDEDSASMRNKDCAP